MQHDEDEEVSEDSRCRMEMDEEALLDGVADNGTDDSVAPIEIEEEQVPLPDGRNRRNKGNRYALVINELL